MNGSSALTVAGLNAFATRPRSFRWASPSMVFSDANMFRYVSWPGRSRAVCRWTARGPAMDREENVTGSLRTACCSSYRGITYTPVEGSS
ncbi:hypothetical protein GCM10029964_107210 [Kibdelosporangium lantanae]